MNKYLELIKINISILVSTTCYIGYYLGLRYNGQNMIDYDSWITFFYLLIGTIISSSGAATLNQCLEVKYDSKMERTKNRPLPKDEIALTKAFIFGILFSLIGPLIIWLKINILCSAISFLTIFIYVFIYTPLKRYSTLNTIVGAIPGALPPLGGWVAATNTINMEGLMLFGILFTWQIPHFLSLAVIYKDDYLKGGFKMLPSFTTNNNVVSFQILFFTMALIYTSVGIFVLKLTSFVYVFGAILLGLIFLFYSSYILFDYSSKNIKRIFIFSIVYLPALLVLIIIDSFF
tara:strand:+ start:783 stop:1652 length:870 start_codon:yes stop_codon:yes gene_type:complete